MKPNIVWLIERKHPTETDAGWTPVSGKAYLDQNNAKMAALRLTGRFWLYRAVGYQRADSGSEAQ